MKRKLITALTTLFFLGLLVACGDAPSNNNNNNNQTNNSNNNNNGDGPCTANSCPKGQFCFNGICAVGCNTDNECADNQYCDTDMKQCANKEAPPTCPDTPCQSGQECVSGYCSAKSSTPAKDPSTDNTACKPSVTGADGCTKQELCVPTDDDKTQCRQFPPCSQDGKCNVGLIGAVCNNGLIEGKARICLVGACKGDDNCPANWSCVKPGGSVLGFCSDGSFGMACKDDSQCGKDLTCAQAAPGTLGTCFTKTPGLPNFP